jgi:hypothetical protein
VFGQPTDACLNKENSSDLAVWCIYLSFVVLTSDIGAPGVLLDVIEQNHGDKVFAAKIEFVRHLPSGRALIMHTFCGEATALTSDMNWLRLSRDF